MHVLSSKPLPSHEPRAPHAWTQRLGVWGCYLFVFFALLGITPATAGLAALTLAFLPEFRHWRALGSDPLVRVALVFGGYVAAHSLATYLTAPAEELAEVAGQTGADWLKLLLFIPFAYWAGGHPERIGWLLSLALLGFAVGILRKIDWAGFDVAFFQTRFEVYLPAIAFGMFTALGALGLIALRESFWNSPSGGIPRWLRASAWLLLLAMMLEGLFLSYSRGSWIAFAVAALLLSYLEWKARRRRTPGRTGQRMMTVFSGLLAAAAIAGFLLTLSDEIAERLLYENQVAAQLLRGEWADLPPSSIGLRVHALRFAADLWGERPWVGWGAGSSRYLIAHSERPELMMGTSWMPHLHNAYAEILFQLGAIGLILITAILWLLARGTARECRVGGVPAAMCRFLLVTLVFVLLWNLINYRIVRHDWTFFWIIFAGIAYSFRLRSLIENEGEPPAASTAGNET